ILAFDNHTNGPLTDLRGKARIFSHPVYLSLKEFSLQDSRGDSHRYRSADPALSGGGQMLSHGA
ncbi:hypothetical protein, partial [Escherichia sp. MOD1-EC5426]|uniref:hypothetical protein n=1 Tax=Escherichia sp. MOD1-EC5426 TaxID=2093867 RepID=UPI001EDEA132